MTLLHSLSARLVLYWIIGSLVIFFSTPVTVQIPLSFFYGGDHRQALEVWTTKRARGILIDSLHRTADGRLEIAMTDALRAHIARNPGFRYAAFDPDTGELTPGSSAELASNFRDTIKNSQVFGSLFHLTGDPNPNARGYIRTTTTRFGRLGTIVYGCDFHWDDVLFQLNAYLVTENFVAYVLLCGVLSAVGFTVVRRAMDPLRKAAAEVGAIDVNSLDHRVSEVGMPSEILPFVEAVNVAFRRVAEGVARQKRFTANSAHELRTPIAILTARIDKLGDEPVAQAIKRDALRIRTLLEQLLVLAQIEERGAHNPPAEIDLRSALLSTIVDYMPIAFAAGRHIDFDAPPGAVAVRAHEWAVESVVTNLIDNALRTEPAGSAVIVSLTEEGEVRVIDHGEGVRAQDRDAIFEPFWRKSEAARGAGLGLAIVRELMERQGGAIRVEETPGGGATFVLAFAR